MGKVTRIYGVVSSPLYLHCELSQVSVIYAITSHFEMCATITILKGHIALWQISHYLLTNSQVITELLHHLLGYTLCQPHYIIPSNRHTNYPIAIQYNKHISVCTELRPLIS